MGKRELLLVIGFVVVGALVYQLTAPPAQAGEKSFSFSQVMEAVRRHVRGNRASTEVTNQTTYPLTAGTNELRVSLSAQSLTIIGEDRSDIAAELRVWSNGYDDAEAEKLAKATALKPVEGAGSLSLGISYPDPGTQRAHVVLKVPSRLRVQIAAYGGRLTITGTADVELLNTRGQAEVKEISGRVSGTHRGGDLNISDVGSLKLRRAEPMSGSRRSTATRRFRRSRASCAVRKSRDRSTSTPTRPTSPSNNSRKPTARSA